MDGYYPIEDAVFVLKGGKKLGPYQVEELLDALEGGQFSPEDICLREGAVECERLREILDWEEAEIPKMKNFESGEPIPENVLRPRRGTFDDSSTVLDGDTLLYAGHPSILNFPFALSCLVAGATIGAWLIPVSSTFALCSFGVAAFGLAYLSMIRFTRDYHIVPKRIEVIKGLIARSSNEVRIADIRAINVTCRGLGGIFGIGTVDFYTAGDQPEVTFQNIWAAKRVKALVRRLQDAE